MLDVEIQRNPDGTLAFDVYRKPTHTNQYIRRVHSPRSCPNPFTLHIILLGVISTDKWAFLGLPMRSRMPRGACMKFTKKIKGFSRGWPFFQKALYFLCKLHTGASRHPRPHRELQKRSFVSWIKASHYDVEGKRVWTRSRGMNTPTLQAWLRLWRPGWGLWSTHVHSPRSCPNSFTLHVIMWGFNSWNKRAFLQLSEV